MSLSLTKSITTCKVDTSQTNRIQSDRFLNPENMVCVPWNGSDLTGREICENSWNTKSAGCNSSRDRVDIENDLRPKYFEYVTYSAAGLNGDLYSNQAVVQNTSAQKYRQNLYNNNPSYGNQFGATNIPSCGYNAYEKAMNQQEMSVLSTNRRNRQYSQQANRNNSMMKRAGI